MGYLDNSSITVDAILTKKGRELLAKGGNAFKITQYALADDEVDYDLWNPNDLRGSAFYGAVIEALPLTEALPDETQVMKYKLITLPPNTAAIPQLNVGNSALSFRPGSSGQSIRPKVDGNTNANSRLGYTAIIADSSIATLEVIESVSSTNTISSPQFTGDSGVQSVSLIGKAFNVIPNFSGAGLVTNVNGQLVNSVSGTTKTTTITILGNETGGRSIITVTLTT